MPKPANPTTAGFPVPCPAIANSSSSKRMRQSEVNSNFGIQGLNQRAYYQNRRITVTSFPLEYGSEAVSSKQERTDGCGSAARISAKRKSSNRTRARMNTKEHFRK